MNRSRLTLLSLSVLASLGLAGCSSELRLHMREARTALGTVDALSQSGDYAVARVSALRMKEEVRAALTTTEPGATATEKELALARLLAEWETGSWQSLDAALAKSDRPGSIAALAAVKGQCTSCHAYAGRPGIQL